MLSVVGCGAARVTTRVRAATLSTTSPRLDGKPCCDTDFLTNKVHIFKNPPEMCFLTEANSRINVQKKRRWRCKFKPPSPPVSILSMLRVALVSDSPDAGDCWERNGDKGWRCHLPFLLAISHLTYEDNRCIRELLWMLIQQPWWHGGTLLGPVSHGC